MERISITAAVFTLKDLLAAVPGLDAGRLQHWLNRGPLNATNPGSGRPRLFSGLQVIEAAVLYRFTKLGINVGESADWWAKIAGEVCARAEDIVTQRAGSGAIEAVWLIVTDPETGDAAFRSSTMEMVQVNPAESLSSPMTVVLRAEQIIVEVLARLRAQRG